MTRVVTELRHSIFDLRHEIAAGPGLGESLVRLRQPGQRHLARWPCTSPSTRRAPGCPRDVEFELLRIAQEAMANARKHSGAREPVAALHRALAVRRDRGAATTAPTGTAPQRLPGLKIMRERSAEHRRRAGHRGARHAERPGTRVRSRRLLGRRQATASLPKEAGDRHPGTHDDRAARSTTTS